MTDEEKDDVESIAGVPSARSNTIILGFAIGVLAVPIVGLIGWALWHASQGRLADTLGEIEVPSLDHPVEKKLELAGGTPLMFAIDTSYSFSGNPVVHLDVTLERDGNPVANQDCRMKGFTGVGASGSGSNVWYGDAGWNCNLDVPAGGAALVRISVRKAGTGSLELTHTKVLVKRR